MTGQDPYRPMARDLAAIGVRVCAIAPGAFATPRLSSPQVQQLLLQDVVFPQRLGHPDVGVAELEEPG